MQQSARVGRSGRKELGKRGVEEERQRRASRGRGFGRGGEGGEVEGSAAQGEVGGRSSGEGIVCCRHANLLLYGTGSGGLSRT